MIPEFMHDRNSYPSVLRMAAPLVVSFWMRAAFTLVDTFYASFVGDAAVAAIGLAIPFEYLMIAFWVGASTGLTAALSRGMGERAGRKIDQYLRASRAIVLIVSPVFAVLGLGIWLFAGRAGLQPEVADAFAVYGSVLIGGSAFTAFWSIIPDSVIKAHQDTRSTMWAGIWSNLTNISLNTLFIFVFDWGIFGIALSTVLGRITGLVYALARARYHEEKRERSWVSAPDTNGRLDPSPYWTILALAIPSSLTFLLMSTETAIVNGFLAHMDHPTEAIAAYSIFFRIALFFLNPIIALAVALLPYMARRFGEEDMAGVRRGLRQCGTASAVYSLVIVGPLMFLTAPWIADWLAEAPLTTEYATFALWLVPLLCLTGAPFLLCRPVFEAMQQGKPGLVMAVIRFGVLTPPACWLGVRVAEAMGQPGLYGLLIALLAVAAASSAGFTLWLAGGLPAAARLGRAGSPPHAESLGSTAP